MGADTVCNPAESAWSELKKGWKTVTSRFKIGNG